MLYLTEITLRLRVSLKQRMVAQQDKKFLNFHANFSVIAVFK
jgi:hypothetical protein